MFVVRLKAATEKPKKKRIIIIKKKDDRVIQVKRKTVRSKHKDNLATILKHSNATPIKKYGCFGYMCCFCPAEYSEPAALKEHTLEMHTDETDCNFMLQQKSLKPIKLDITDLKCSICARPFQDLQLFIDHLMAEHGKHYNVDEPTHVIPFEFTSDLLVCVICKNQYCNFKMLLEHMSTHYENYVCDVCGKGFIAKHMLQTHMIRHRTGEFKCEFCSKCFNTRIKQKEHERAVHVCQNKRSKCGYCGEKFNDYTKKNDHVVKMHGGKPIVLQCQACQKTFDNMRAFNSHTKTYHLMERRRPYTSKGKNRSET